MALGPASVSSISLSSQTSQSIEAVKRRCGGFLIEEPADQIRLGQCNDSILIFLSKQDRKLWATVVEQLMDRLDGGTLQEIYRSEREHFANSDYVTGFTALMGAYRSQLYPPSVDMDWGAVLGGLGSLLLGVLACCFCLHKFGLFDVECCAESPHETDEREEKKKRWAPKSETRAKAREARANSRATHPSLGSALRGSLSLHTKWANGHANPTQPVSRTSIKGHRGEAYFPCGGNFFQK